ncbi:MAG: tetratricopeptide repeat protein [Candidatus Heimdallarchaeota archaeon]|nr:tetratricopeptide repeat protein [Candidatus Heimdallarchaeota archaeon]MDH5647296.1 tetratricopeptide repeat protein [Candidatus Heimdallarchaeota archaeon]
MEEFTQFYQNGIKFHKEGEFKKAISNFILALKLNPDDHKTLYNLANVYADIDEVDKATNLYKKIKNMNSTTPAVYYNLGNMLLDENNFEDAILEYDTAIGLNPKFVNAWFNRGVAKFSLQLLDDAIIDFEETLKLDSTFHHSMYNLACIYSIKNQPTESINYLKQILGMKTGLDYYQIIKYDENLNNIREEEEFLSLLS